MKAEFVQGRSLIDLLADDNVTDFEKASYLRRFRKALIKINDFVQQDNNLLTLSHGEGPSVNHLGPGYLNSTSYANTFLWIKYTYKDTTDDDVHSLLFTLSDNIIIDQNGFFVLVDPR